MITRDDGYSWVSPRISMRGFTEVLYKHNSPATETAPESYAAINEFHVDPLFLLAQFEQESSFGVSGHAAVTHAWGNMRDGRDVQGVPSTGSDGGFMMFADWVDGAAATAAHFDTAPYRGLTIRDAIYKWAPPDDGNDTESYINGVVSRMNEWADGNVDGGRKMRIVVSAGHENIESITDDHLGAGWGERLRGGTGALGTESRYTGRVADELVRLLQGADVDAVRTDAIYHEDVYGQPADLVIVCHADGVSGTPDQWAGACVVHSGPSTYDTDSRAQEYVDAWMQTYPKVTGLNDFHLSTNPTVDMQQYYGGHYRTADTPMVIVEHGIWGDANGQRQDIPSPERAALGDAQAAALLFGLKGVPDVQDGGGDQGSGGGTGKMERIGNADVATASDGTALSVYHRDTKHSIIGGFLAQYERGGFGARPPQSVGWVSPVYGLPLTQEFTIVDPRIRGGQPTVVQYFERARFELVNDGDEQRVELGRVGLEAMEGLPAALIPADAWRG